MEVEELQSLIEKTKTLPDFWGLKEEISKQLEDYRKLLREYES